MKASCRPPMDTFDHLFDARCLGSRFHPSESGIAWADTLHSNRCPSVRMELNRSVFGILLEFMVQWDRAIDLFRLKPPNLPTVVEFYLIQGTEPRRLVKALHVEWLQLGVVDGLRRNYVHWRLLLAIALLETMRPIVRTQKSIVPIILGACSLNLIISVQVQSGRFGLHTNLWKCHKPRIKSWPLI